MLRLLCFSLPTQFQLQVLLFRLGQFLLQFLYPFDLLADGLIHSEISLLFLVLELVEHCF